MEFALCSITSVIANAFHPGFRFCPPTHSVLLGILVLMGLRCSRVVRVVSGIFYYISTIFDS